MSALRFDLESGRTKCISDEIKVGSMAVGKYHVVGPDPNSPDSQLPDCHHISLRVTSPYGNSMHYAENVQSGHFAFTAAEAGDYLACFWAPDHKPPVTIGFEFDWRSGVTAKDWPSVAKKGQVDRFAAVIMRIREPKTTALIFASGKMVCTGAKSEQQSKLAARKYARIIQKLGFPAKFKDFKIQNIVGSCDVKFPIRLEGLAYSHGAFSSYEPELFPLDM